MTARLTPEREASIRGHADAHKPCDADFHALLAELDALRADRDAALTECVITTVVDPVGGPVAAPCAIDGCQYARAARAEAERDRLRDIAVPTWREKGRDQAFIESLAICHKGDADTMDDLDDGKYGIETKVREKLARLERAEATLAAIRAWALSPTALGVPVTSRDERGNAVIAAKGHVLALLDAAPTASADGPGVGGPVTGATEP